MSAPVHAVVKGKGGRTKYWDVLQLYVSSEQQGSAGVHTASTGASDQDGLILEKLHAAEGKRNQIMQVLHWLVECMQTQMHAVIKADKRFWYFTLLMSYTKINMLPEEIHTTLLEKNSTDQQQHVFCFGAENTPDSLNKWCDFKSCCITRRNLINCVLQLQLILNVWHILVNSALNKIH